MPYFQQVQICNTFNPFYPIMAFNNGNSSPKDQGLKFEFL